MSARDKVHRLWHVDCVRGAAVVSMVFYHFMWDVMFFGLYPVDVTDGGWRIFARIVAVTFLLLAGASMVLTAETKPAAARDRQWLERGAKVFGWGLVVTAVTRLFLGDAFVLYGILHLIGTAFLLAPFLWRVRRWAPSLGVLFVAGGIVLSRRSPELSMLLPYAIPLGVHPEFYPAVDYFPVFPWLGVVMIGIGAGRMMLPLIRRVQASGPPPPVLAQLAAVGRHALAVYILHQPVLLAGFFAFGYSVW